MGKQGFIYPENKTYEVAHEILWPHSGKWFEEREALSRMLYIMRNVD